MPRRYALVDRGVDLSRERRSTLTGVTRIAPALASGVLGLLLASCGGGGGDGSPVEARVEDPGPVHVHGLGVNPRDGALFIATHTGLFRAPAGERKARRVGDRFQDTMGFTVVGPDRFLGSGHPDGRDRLPPFLGLIETRDAGRTWKPVSLLGEVDFHVLEARGRRVYGFGSDFESRRPRLLVSADGGRSWRRRDPPESLVTLAIDPRDSEHAVAAGESGLYASPEAARSWRPLRGPAGLLAWTIDGTLHVVDRDGRVHVSGDRGRSWRPMGETGGEPAAFDSAGDELYVALHDGTVKRSGDHGRSWELRSRP